MMVPDSRDPGPDGPARRRYKLLYVVGTRPNFMKTAPVIAAVRDRDAAAATRPAGGVRCDQVLVHTGQHYDACMSDAFFRDLGLPDPDYALGAGSGTHAAQTARVMTLLEPILIGERPDLVIVPGDVNSTLAAAVTAAKLHVPVAHIEAGLRSGDREMPEEINRLVADAVADLLLVTSADAVDNLAREGIAGDHVVFVGNPMIDSLERHRATAIARDVPASLGLAGDPYALVTLHRPSNVDDAASLAGLVATLRAVATVVPIVFPIHVRTRRRLADSGLLADLEADPEIVLADPLGYLDFLSLMATARVVITDSGGIQEETTVLGVPCLTVRTTTERPVTITEGTNRLVPPGDRRALLKALAEAVATPAVARRPRLWDGHAGERIATAIETWLANRPPKDSAHTAR